MLKAANNNALPRRGVGLKRPSAPTIETEPNTLPPQQALWRRIWKHPMLMHYHRLDDIMESYREHKRILDAIHNGQKEEAIQALENNIQ